MIEIYDPFTEIRTKKDDFLKILFEVTIMALEISRNRKEAQHEWEKEMDQSINKLKEVIL